MKDNYLSIPSGKGLDWILAYQTEFCLPLPVSLFVREWLSAGVERRESTWGIPGDKKPKSIQIR